MNDTIEIHEEKDSGFTLIELLIVIVILGILATVTVFAVGGITDRGTESACKADAKTLEVAIEAWRITAVAGVVPAPNAVPSETDLMTGGFLNSESAKYNIGAAGTPADPRGYTLTPQDPACDPA